MVEAHSREQLLDLLYIELDKLPARGAEKRGALNHRLFKQPEAAFVRELWRAGVILFGRLGDAAAPYRVPDPANRATAFSIKSTADAGLHDQEKNRLGALAELFQSLHDLLESVPQELPDRHRFLQKWDDNVRSFFREKEQITNELLREHSDWSEACWRTLRNAHRLGLSNWTTAIGELFCSQTVIAIRLAVKVRNWPVAITMRGRYLAVSHAARIRASRNAVDSGPRLPPPVLHQLGMELAHRHAGSEDPSRIITRIAPSAAARAFDIAMVYRGKTAEDWKVFCSGYYSAFEGKKVSRKADRALVDKIRRPIEHAGIRHPAHSTNFIADLCTSALRSRPMVISSLAERLHQLQAIAELEAQSGHAAVLARDSADIHEPTKDAALNIFSSAIEKLYDQAQYDAVCSAVSSSMLDLCGVLSGTGLATIEGFEQLSAAQLLANSSDAFDMTLQACKTFLSGETPQNRTLALLHSQRLLQSTPSFPKRKEVISVYVSATLKVAAIWPNGAPYFVLIDDLAKEIAKAGPDQEIHAFCQACLDVTSTLVKPQNEQTPAELEYAIGLCGRLKELTVLLAPLQAMRRRRIDCYHPEYGDIHLHPAAISQRTRSALVIEDWSALAVHARRDLIEMRSDAEAKTRLTLVGYLALALRMSAQLGAASAIDCAYEALDLLEEYAASFLENSEILAGPGEVHVWSRNAGDLALAAISLAQMIPPGHGRDFPEAAVLLLERAVALTSIDRNHIRYGTCLHDLGHAYQLCARLDSGDRRVEFLELAAASFRESLVVYQILREQPANLMAMHNRQACFDYLNLGQAYLNLGMEGESLNLYASAMYLREALCVFAMARDAALETGHAAEATHAQNCLASLGTQLALACLEHTRENKGVLRRDFSNWLCAIEGPVFTTWDFATRYACFALEQAGSAIAMSHRLRDEGLIQTSLRSVFEVWRLAELRHGVTGAPILFDDNWSNMRALRQRGMSSIDGILGRLSADAEGLETLLPEISDYQRYFAARAGLALFDEVSRHSDDLLSAVTHFDTLCATGGLIPRALSQPYSDWFRVTRDDDRIAVNGLLLAATKGGLEITLLAHRQGLVVGGLHVEGLAVDTRESSWIKTNSVTAITGSYPQIDWSGVPTFVPVLTGQCRSGTLELQILAVQIPTASWDSWVVHLGSDDNEGHFEFELPLRVLETDSPKNATSTSTGGDLHYATDVVTLIGNAVVVEVRVERSSKTDRGTIELTATSNRTHLRVTAAKITLALRTTPTIVDTGVAILAKRDNPFVGACGAAMFTLASPSPVIPSSLIRAYSPLYLFDERVDARIVDRLRNASVRQLLVVGVPSNPAELVRLIETVFNPRLELHFLVSSQEVQTVAAAIEHITREISSSIGSALYSVAGSLDDVSGAGAIQVLEVARELAPAAAQMILDLAAFRRLPLEDIPTGSIDAPFSFQLLGDPLATRRAMTALPDRATWADLTAKYIELMQADRFSMIGNGQSEGLRRFQELFARPLAQRPLLIVPVDATSAFLACTPYARHLGAILLPDIAEAARFIAESKPLELYVVDGSRIAADAQKVIALPSAPVDIALSFCNLAGRDHEIRASSVMNQYGTSGVVNRLIAEMRPNAYVVIASISRSEYWASVLAANYAAALGSPLLLFNDDEFFSNDTRTETAAVLTGQRSGEIAQPGSSRHLIPGRSALPSPVSTPSASMLERTLEAMNPAYVGVVSSKLTIPLELIGAPPLGIRYAFGRLCAPDLTSLSLLISAAALREEVRRDPMVRVLIAEAGDAIKGQPLPGARREGAHLSDSLSTSADLSVTFVSGPDDLTGFLRESREAAIIHFAGHGRYDDNLPDESALIFSEGELVASDVPSPLRGSPIVYSNACESGLGRATEELSSWSGLAAAFVQAGAVNYIGSLWPIYDESSLRVAERFYGLLNVGHSTGEALRIAKFEAFNAGDPIWAALVQFGCPRNRLRSRADEEKSDGGHIGGTQTGQRPKPDKESAKAAQPGTATIEKGKTARRDLSGPANPEKAKSYYLSSRRYAERGDWTSAEREILLACELDTTESEYVVAQCDYLCAQDKWPAARDLLLSREKDFSDDWRVYEAFGRIYNQLGDFQASCVSFEKALAGEPDNPAVVQARLGTSYRRLGDFAAAEHYLRLGYATAPSNRLVNLFLLQFLNDRFIDAARQSQESGLAAIKEEVNLVFERAQRAGILDADLLVIRAQLLVSQGKLKGAFEDLDMARRLNPKHPIAEDFYLAMKAELDRKDDQ